MRFTRWLNPSLPQTLYIANILLYVNGVMSLLTILNIGIGGSGYLFLPLALWRSHVPLNDLVTSYGLISLVAGLAYGFAGLGLANGKRIGWQVGVGVAAGAVVLPVLAVGIDVFTSSYVISFIFDMALLVALVHPLSRQYAKVWLEGPDRRHKGNGPRRGLR